MRSIPRVVTGVLAIAAWLVSSAAHAQDSYDISRHANFGAIKTFAFKQTPSLSPVESKTTTYDSPLIQERTNTAIEGQLAARGIKRDDENPDVYVVTHRTYKVEYTYWGPYSYGWGPYWGAGFGPYYDGWNAGPVYSELRGTLTVDLEDARTGSLLWRGVETKHVHETSKPARRDAHVQEEVFDVFKHFPEPRAIATSGQR
jgi:hypothetical protein